MGISEDGHHVGSEFTSLGHLAIIHGPTLLMKRSHLKLWRASGVRAINFCGNFYSQMRVQVITLNTSGNLRF